VETGSKTKSGSGDRSGVDVIVSLLTPDEVEEMDLLQEARLSRENDIEFVSFPIVDRSVPESRGDTVQLIEKLDAALEGGKLIDVHCRQGIGRSALVAAGLLMLRGATPEAAIRKVSDARVAPVPETAEQVRWIGSLPASLTPSKTRV
jgi:protein-tyrosine phosphatase